MFTVIPCNDPDLTEAMAQCYRSGTTLPEQVFSARFTTFRFFIHDDIFESALWDCLAKLTSEAGGSLYLHAVLLDSPHLTACLRLPSRLNKILHAEIVYKKVKEWSNHYLCFDTSILRIFSTNSDFALFGSQNLGLAVIAFHDEATAASILNGLPSLGWQHAHNLEQQVLCFCDLAPPEKLALVHSIQRNYTSGDYSVAILQANDDLPVSNKMPNSFARKLRQDFQTLDQLESN